MKTNKAVCILLFTVIIVTTSCLKKNFLDVNNDPNRVNDNNITPELLFPQAAHAAGALMKSSNTNYAAFMYNWVGYFSTPGDFALPGSETTYEIEPNYPEVLWDNYYNNLFDLDLVQQKALAEGDSVLAGASMVLSAKVWQEVVDIFGSVPYTEVFQNNKTRTPKYDKDVDIYNALQKKLDDAIGYLGKTVKGSFTSVDIVNHGNTAMWIKFANTIKLRLLIHQSEVAGFNPAAEITKIMNNGGVLHRGETISVNPGYSNDEGKQNPFYANWGSTVTGADANPAERANAFIVNILNNSADPRLERFFVPVGNTVVGTVYGLGAGQNPDGAHSSRVGPGLVQSSSQDQWIVPSFESMFLEAEAIARGWMPGDAQAAYENAVRESFVWLGVPDAVNAANTYMANNAFANWANAGTTPLSKGKFIALEKYIALIGFDPVEAWVDIRRLNMLPNNGYISVNPGKISNVLPSRLPYPQSEYTTNSANVLGEGTNNIFTHKIFWQP